MYGFVLFRMFCRCDCVVISDKVFVLLWIVCFESCFRFVCGGCSLDRILVLFVVVVGLRGF